MLGAIILAVVILIALPVGVMMTGALIAAGLGAVLRGDVAAQHEGSELLELNR